MLPLKNIYLPMHTYNSHLHGYHKIQVPSKSPRRYLSSHSWVDVRTSNPLTLMAFAKYTNFENYPHSCNIPAFFSGCFLEYLRLHLLIAVKFT